MLSNNLSSVVRIFHLRFSVRDFMWHRTAVLRCSNCYHRVAFNKILCCGGTSVRHIQPLKYLTTEVQYNGELPLALYETVTEDTLQSLAQKFEDLLDVHEELKDCDVHYSDGVLTVNLRQFGVYVINKQTPNKQIWMSSPISGPKRFDFREKRWIYKHEGVFLHDLLSQEISIYVNKDVDFSDCAYT